MDEPLNPDYTGYHPKWYRRRIPIFWWLRRISYTRFITRELTSLAVGYAAVVLLFEMWCLAQGPEVHGHFLLWLQRPPVVVLHAAVFVTLLFHSLTWFSLAPQALVLRLAGRRLPGSVVLLGHYAAWLVASGLVTWLLLGR